MIVPVWYMPDRTASTVTPHPDKTIADDAIAALVGRARRLGMTPVLKPHVDLVDGSFRGAIAPADRALWFAEYERMLVHYAALARRSRVTTLVMGTELTSMSADTERFRALIRAVRAVYRGRLTYAANWVDEAERVRFWDALDAVGIDAYMPLQTRSARPAVDELVRAWKPWIRRLVRLRARTGKPVLFTELGYASRAGVTRHPSREGDGRRDETLQARAYEAAFRALLPYPWFRGIWWWDWPADRHAGRRLSYTPRGKRAERVLRRWTG